ncbi:MAG: Hsp20/alpha crystallin family protein [Geobacteraceae bacterium]|nr:Hsp20/alpha crystallin family protein [Geobacteraceae bacterium]
MANWDMFRELDNLRREIDEAFRSVGAGRAVVPHFLAGGQSRRFPLVNISEDVGEVRVEALLPGVDPAALEISVLRNTLTVAGERKAPEVVRNQVWHRNERGFGKFSRTIELPAEIDSGKVTAECRDGLLTVTLAKAESAKPKKITVGVS